MMMVILHAAIFVVKGSENHKQHFQLVENRFHKHFFVFTEILFGENAKSFDFLIGLVGFYDRVIISDFIFQKIFVMHFVFQDHGTATGTAILTQGV